MWPVTVRGAPILEGVNLTLDPGEIGVIVGPNGAGKSTLLKAIFGLLTVHSGEIRHDDEDITSLRADQLVEQGLAFVPQEFNVFDSMSVEENLEMGAFVRNDDLTDSIDRITPISRH